MLRNWKLIELATLLAVAAPSPFLLASDKTMPPDAKAIIERIDATAKELKKQIEGVDERLKDAFKGVLRDIVTLQGDHLKLDTKMDKLERSLTALSAAVAELKSSAKLDGLRAKLFEIEDTLGKMQTKTRTSLSPATTARVTFVNLYSDRLIFKINGQDFVVQPEETKTIEGVPAGANTFTVYSALHGIVDQRTRTLTPSETFTLSARFPGR